MDEPAGLSVSRLKQIISAAGLSYEGLVEKSELVDRAREAIALKPETKKAKNPCPPAPPRNSRASFSGYDCTIIDTGPINDDYDLAVVILHGFGATSSDFAGLCPMLASQPNYSGKTIRWVLPQAPNGAMGVPAWWDIHVEEWMAIAMGQADESHIAKLLRKVHPGLPEARNKLTKLVDEVVESVPGLRYDQVVLGGFSQGAMTSIDVALSMPTEKRMAGILCMSGAPIVVEEWARKGPTHSGLKVLMTHGRSDNVLPFVAAGWLKDLLTTANLSVETSYHDQGHTLGPQSSIYAISGFISSCMS